jgi:membrane protease YdiL (CAAX protease family)
MSQAHRLVYPPRWVLGPMDSARKLRWVELLLVVGVAFSGPLLASSYIVLGGTLDAGRGSSALRWAATLVSDALAVCVLVYVLYRQGRGLRDLGVGFARSDVIASFSLAVWSFLVFYTCYYCVGWATVALTGQSVNPHRVPMLEGGLSAGVLVFVAVNSVYEELLARAFVISEVKALIGSPVIAAAASVILQTAYHLYQGLPQAAALAAAFTVFSLYYLSTRRVWPLILAHFYLDLFALIQYSRSGPEG